MEFKQVKEEIKEEESLLLKVFQLEKFIKKYKKPLIAGAVLLVLLVIGIQINNYINTQNLIKTNKAYNQLLQNPNNKQALETLKENKPLFRLYLLKTSNNNIQKLQKVAQGNGIIANIAKYQIAVLKGDKSSIESYAFTMDAMYKDLALLNLERLYLQDKNHQKAEEIALQIKDADIAQFANGLLHYGIVK